MQTTGAALLVFLLRTLMVRADDSLMRQMRTYQLGQFVGGSCFAQLMGEGAVNILKRNSMPGGEEDMVVVHD